MNRRRHLLFDARLILLGTQLSATSLLIWSGAAGAVTAAGGSIAPRIAVVIPFAASECPKSVTPQFSTFTRHLTELGYDVPTLIVSHCFSEVSDLPRVTAELLKDKPALVAVWGSVVAVRSVRQAAPTLPIVFVDVADPVQFGLVGSLGHPGGKTTGVGNITDDLLAKRVQIMRDALPHATRLALLCNLATPLQSDYIRVAEAAARKQVFEAHVYSVQSEQELDHSFATMAKDQMDAMLVLPDAWFFPRLRQLVDLAGQYRIPAIYGNSFYPDLGALFTYGADIDDMSYRAATYVDKILRGADPADLPVEQPSKFNFVINSKSARALGIRVPTSVMLQATRVIE